MKFTSVSLLLAAALFKSSLGCQNLLETSPSTLQSLLPPSLAWNDTASVQEFVVASTDPFVTPAESSEFQETATHDEVTDFFTQLAQESPYVQMKSIATLANDKQLWLVTVSGEQKFNPKDMTKPVILATAGIHAGESSGVNAGMMFLRNLVRKEEYQPLLEAVNFLFVPVLNTQGYLRQSINGRINQHGPSTSGRRGNGQWLNLNRDFAKLDTPEVQAVVRLMSDYDLSFYTDLHSTDGMNYQPDVTWCDNGNAGLSNEIHQWLRGVMEPSLKELLETNYHHKTSVCFSANDGMDPTAGYYPYFSDGAAYSTNYADHRQIPSYLLEMHSLKPNKQRVLGAYAYLMGLVKIIGEEQESLQLAIGADRSARVDPVPVAWDFNDPAPMVEWDIFEYEVVKNEVLGIDQMIWTNKPLTITVEQSTRSTPLNPPQRAHAYIIPAVWTEVIDKLALHGIQMEELTEEATVDVIQYRTEDASVKRLREGRPEIQGADTAVKENCTRTFDKRDIVVKMDQPLGTLATALLEPAGESSFFLWGFFSSKLQSHEYPENYIMIPIAEQMLQDSAELREEWEAYKVTNPSYVNETEAVVDWFFRRSAFYDDEAYVYPVAVIYEESKVADLPLKPYEVDDDLMDLVDSLDDKEDAEETSSVSVTKATKGPDMEDNFGWRRRALRSRRKD